MGGQANGRPLPIRVPALASRAPPPPPPPPIPPPVRGPRLDLVVGGGIVGGLGLVGLGVGAACGVAPLSDASRARDEPDLCPDDRCTGEGWTLIQDAEEKATVRTALLVVGGLATATGATLVVLGLMLEEAPADAALIVPVIGPGYAGLSLGGVL